MKAASGVSNMRLAHEIAVEEDFRFTKSEEPEDRLDIHISILIFLPSGYISRVMYVLKCVTDACHFFNNDAIVSHNNWMIISIF